MNAPAPQFTSAWSPLTRQPLPGHRWLSADEARQRWAQGAVVVVVEPQSRWAVWWTRGYGARCAAYRPSGTKWREVDFRLLQPSPNGDLNVWRSVQTDWYYDNEDQFNHALSHTGRVRTVVNAEGDGLVEISDTVARTRTTHHIRVTNSPTPNWLTLSDPPFGDALDTLVSFALTPPQPGRGLSDAFGFQAQNLRTETAPLTPDATAKVFTAQIAQAPDETIRAIQDLASTTEPNNPVCVFIDTADNRAALAPELFGKQGPGDRYLIVPEQLQPAPADVVQTATAHDVWLATFNGAKVQLVPVAPADSPAAPTAEPAHPPAERATFHVQITTPGRAASDPERAVFERAFTTANSLIPQYDDADPEEALDGGWDEFSSWSHQPDELISGSVQLFGTADETAGQFDFWRQQLTLMRQALDPSGQYLWRVRRDDTELAWHPTHGFQPPA